MYSRRAGASKILVEGGADARFASTGHLLYVKEGALLAAPFDVQKLELTGGAVGMAADVMQAAYFRIQGDDTGAAQFSISATGTLCTSPAGSLLCRALGGVGRSNGTIRIGAARAASIRDAPSVA